MSQNTALICEAPAPRGHRFRALLTSAILAAALVLSSAPIASSAPQSSGKSSNSKPSTTSKATHTSKKGKKTRKHWEPMQKAPTNDRIEEIQTALSREGYYKGTPTKKFDSDTQEALRRFQEEHGMTGSGKLDATTLQKLGLGSDIAGVSAPKPAKSPSNPPPSTAPQAPTPTTSTNSDPGA